MGEFGEVFGRLITRALGKALGQNPFFQRYEWQILACVFGIPAVWMLFRDHLFRKPVKPIETAPPPSALRTEYRNFRQQLAGAVLRAGLNLPNGLRIPIILSIIALALAAFGSMPYDFFILLRILLFVTCSIVLASLWKTQSVASWFWVIVGITVLYNPLLPIHLHRDTWEWINIATIPVFGVLCVLIRPTTIAEAG